jgi:hypothetical protein
MDKINLKWVQVPDLIECQKSFFLFLTFFLKYNNHGKIQYYCIE